MKKKRVSLFVFLLIVVATVAVTAAGVSADPKEKEPDGIWCYTPLFDTIDILKVQNSTFFMTVDYVSTWTGAIDGESEDSAMVIWKNFDAIPPGPGMFAELAVFDSVEVGGVSGGLEMQIDGAGEPGDWYGNWFITDATGDLEGIEGYGEWWGVGYTGDGCGELFYRAEELEVPEIDVD